MGFMADFINEAARAGEFARKIEYEDLTEKNMDNLVRRVKDLTIGGDSMLSIMQSINKNSPLETKLAFDLPEGVVVLGVYADWTSTAIYIRVAHPSFDLVPYGDIPPKESLRLEEYCHPDQENNKEEDNHAINKAYTRI